MIFKITERDKKLLFYLLIFSIITLGGHFFIARPFHKYKILKQRYEIIEKQKLEIDYRLSQKNKYEIQIKDFIKEIKKYQQKLIVEFQKEEIDTFLSNTLVAGKMEPMVLSFGETNSDNTFAGVVKMPIKIIANGKRESVGEFLTLLQKIPFSTIEYFSIGNEEHASHSIQMTFYMMPQYLIGKLTDEEKKD